MFEIYIERYCMKEMKCNTEISKIATCFLWISVQLESVIPKRAGK